MNCVEPNELEKLAVQDENIVHLPLGLLGFETVKEYVLLAKPEEAPFLWLQVLGKPSTAFLVVPPAAVVPDYRPDLSEEDVAFLGLKQPEDALLLNIVTLRGPKEATVNLKGPVVINRHTFIGKQVIPVNAAEYPVRHPLSVA